MRVTSFRLWIFVIAGLGIAHARAPGQVPEIHGLTGGFAFGAMNWRLDQRAKAADFAGGLYAGYRAPLGRVGAARVSLTPHVSVLMSEFAGIRLNSSDIAVSRLDLGVQLAARMANVRPYVLAQLGRITTEQYAGSDLVNYSAAMPAFGLGIELPRANPCGAGFDLAVRHTSGDLTSGEWRRTDAPPPPAGHFSTWIFTLGWGGRFRGTRLLFACH